MKLINFAFKGQETYNPKGFPGNDECTHFKGFVSGIWEFTKAKYFILQ